MKTSFVLSAVPDKPDSTCCFKSPGFHLQRELAVTEIKCDLSGLLWWVPVVNF